MKKNLFIVCLFLLLSDFGVSLPVRAAHDGRNSYIFSEIDRQQGLSNSAVICIYKDDSELMWFGTYDGVNCFDGAQMEIFRADFSKSRTLDNNVIYGIGKADGNNLWISTLLGVNRFSRDQRRVVANYTVPSGTHLCSNSRGDTWLVGRDSIAYYNTCDGGFVGIKGPSFTVDAPEVRSFVAADGNLWLFLSANGASDLCRVSVSAFDKAASSVRGHFSTAHFHHKTIETIFYQDDKSFCFIDADKGLYLYDVERQTKVYIRNIQPLLEKYGPIVGIVPFYDDFMIAFRTNGLVRLKATESYREEVINRNLRIFALYKDPVQGILWIGADGKGAMMYTKQYSVATNLMMQRLSSNFTRQVRCMMTDLHGGLWFGTKGDGLIQIPDYAAGMEADKAVVYSPERMQTATTYMRGDIEFPVYTLKQSTGMDGFWIGSGSDGLFYYRFGDTRPRRVELPTGERLDEIHGVCEVNDTTLYVATANSGFVRLTVERDGERIAAKKLKKYRFFHKQQEVSTFFALLSEGDSVLWLGSREQGIVRFSPATGHYRILSLKAMLDRPVDDVLSICRARNGDLLAGTTAGLVRLHFEGAKVKATYVGREQGLLNDMIHGILEDANGFLWLSTNKGLIKYNPVNGSSHAYYYSGGVRIGEFSDDAYYKCPYTGRLFFGGIDGLLYIDRASSGGDEFYPEILLRRITVGREEVSPADCYTADRQSLRLRYDDEGFALGFAAPDFISGADLEYSWMLEGYDRDWSRFDVLHEAAYPDVPVGNYLFKVRYRKDIFDTDFKTFSIPLRILPRWYQTTVMRLSLVLLILGGLLYFVHIIRRYVRQKRILSKLLESENSNALKAGTAYWNHEITDVLTSIYRACDTLRGDTSLYRQRSEAIESIRENVMSLLLPTDGLQSTGDAENPPPSAIHFSVAGRMYLKEISDGVMSQLLKRGCELGNIDVNISRNLSFSVYKNAFRLLFDYVYLFVADSRRFTVSASEDGNMLTLSFRSSHGVLSRLHESLTSDSCPADAPKNAEALFNMHLLHRFVREAMAQLQPVVALSDAGDDPELSLSFRPAVAEEPETGKKIILLLEDHDEMCWFVNGILSKEYVIYQVRSIQQAVEFLESSNPAVFLVDMMMYVNAEETFMEFINRNGSLLSKPAFVPMLTWKFSSAVQRNLILHADSFIMLPYDIVFLREIIHKAIYGRMGGKQIFVDGLAESVTGLVTCTTGEQLAFVRKMVAIIEDNIDRENLGSSFIAERLAMSPRQFYRKFKEISEHSPAEFIKNYRLEKASVLLLNENLAIKDVMAEIGITSRSYLYREFNAKFGMTPSEYRTRHGGGVE